MQNFFPTTTFKKYEKFKTRAGDLHKVNTEEIHLGLAVDCYEVLILSKEFREAV